VRHLRWIAVLLGGLLLLGPNTARAEDYDRDIPRGAYQDGTTVCITPTVRIGALVIAGGRCYTTYLVRNATGTYLGFGPGGRSLAGVGQVVSLDSPQGNAILGRLLGMVPLTTTLNVPIGTVQFQPVQIRIQGSTIILDINRGNQRTSVEMHER
jgi:hypothetical protein